MKKLLFFIFLKVANSGMAQVPDWTGQISCILYSHCTSCHNPNGIAPFSLLNYSDAVLYASSIKYQVQSKSMPPFPADVNYQHYAYQNTLTDQEIDLIAQWVDNGTPSGDTSQAIQAPVYSAGSVFTNPGFSESIGSYTVPALTSDEYRCFVISNPSTSDSYIAAIEVLPGNLNAVHHVLIYSDTSNIPVQLDNADPAPGYLNFGGTGSISSQLIGGWVPGGAPYYLPDGMGMFLPAGSRIVIQIHYPENASGLTDSTRISFLFRSGAVRPVYNAAPLDHYFSIVDGPLFIPANTVRTFHAEYTVLADVSVLSVTPHAHLICASMTSYAVLPSGDTVRLEHIPHWDFHWQNTYVFQKPLFLPAGTVLYGEATYDNTPANPHNPNDPPLDVSLGEATTDEMMLFYFVYTLYQSGDENIVIDTSDHIKHYQDCIPLTGVSEHSPGAGIDIFPNPAQEEINIQSIREIESLQIYNYYGVKVMEPGPDQFFKPSQSVQLNTEFLSPGIYLVNIRTSQGNSFSKKIIIH